MVAPASSTPLAVVVGGIPVSTGILSAALVVSWILLGVWWLREHRLAQTRSAMRRIYRLGEQMAADRTRREILARLRTILPGTLRITGVNLFLYNRSSHNLDEVADDTDAPTRTISPERADGTLESAIAACFRNRSLMVIPDSRRSPMSASVPRGSWPRSAMLVPLFTQGELIGVLALFHATRPRNFSLDERAVAQHLGNQIAISLKLREQQTREERILRSETLSATDQLIASVASELRSPLAEIEASASALVARGEGHTAEAEAIQAEARKASGVLTRLLAIGRPQSPEAPPVNVTELLRDVAGESVSVDTPSEALFVQAHDGQLREIIHGLLTYARRRAVVSASNRAAIRATRLAGTIGIEIGFSAGGDSADPWVENDASAGVLSPAVCRAILHNYGGELRSVSTQDGGRRFDIILPASLPAQAPPQMGFTYEDEERTFTALVADPDEAVRRRLAALLAEKGHRSVPAGSGAEAAYYSSRLAFDLIFSAARLPDMNCLELFDKVAGSVARRICLTEGPESEPPEGAEHVLRKPVEPEELDRLLRTIGSQPPAPAR